MNNKVLDIETVGIIGLGMLGGSIATGLKHLHSYKKIIASTRQREVLNKALTQGVIDEGYIEHEEVFKKADLIIIATPIEVTVEIINKYASFLKKGAIVTDIGSVKEFIVKNCRNTVIDNGAHFIGGHPMAGAEFNGFDYAKGDMYYGAIVFLTPTTDDSQEALQKVTEFWNILKAKTYILNVKEHDKIVAYTSQTLHLFSAIVAKTGIEALGHKDCVLAAAGGFKGMTRVASSNTTMWEQILKTNTKANLNALEDLIQTMNVVKEMLIKEDMNGISNFLKDAKDKHDKWLEDWTKRKQEIINDLN